MEVAVASSSVALYDLLKYHSADRSLLSNAMPQTEIPRSEKPTLYALGPDGGSLHFWFAQCACGCLNFPQTSPGCRVCGEALESAQRISQAGEGTLQVAITIHVPLTNGMKTPVTIGRIEMADGIVEEGVLEIPAEAALTPGLRLKAIAHMSPDGQTYSCVFTRVPADVQ